LTSNPVDYQSLLPVNTNVTFISNFSEYLGVIYTDIEDKRRYE